MNDPSNQDRAALVAMLDEALAAETRTEAPPEAEQCDWLFSTSEPSGPDENGWMSSVPTEPMWVPRTLVFWRMVALTGGGVTTAMCDPRHSLARWPAIEEEVCRAYGEDAYRSVVSGPGERTSLQPGDHASFFAALNAPPAPTNRLRMAFGDYRGTITSR